MIINTNLRIKLFAVIMLFSIGAAQAQLSNCNVFLKGNYLEAGINWNGAFGSSSHPPFGYHADTLARLHNAVACGGAATSDTALGFVADPEKNGWTSGSPAYFGDFILPGLPQEGWSYLADIGAGNVQINSWNHDAATSDTLIGASCSNQEYSDTGTMLRTKWQAVTGGVYITQITTLDTAQLFVNVDVIIENTSLGLVDNIYYMRTINPHNDELLSHNMSTVNKIEYQLPNALNRCVVSARGTMHSDAYLVLGTQDDRAIAFLDKTSNLPNTTTIDNIYNMDPSNYYYNVLDSTTTNASIGLIYSLGSLPSGHQTEFNFVYGFRHDVIDSALDVSPFPTKVGHSNKLEMRAFPNPASDHFKIAGISPGDKVTLFNIMGQRLVTDMPNDGGLYSLGDIAPGTYFLMVTDNSNNVVSRLTIKKI